MKKNLNLGVHFTIHFSAYTLPYTSTGNGNGLVPNRWQAITYTPDEDPDAFNAIHASLTGLILGLHPANERRRYKVTPSLIGLAQI